MGKAKPSTVYQVPLADGSIVTVLGRSAKGAVSYAEQVAGLVVDRRKDAVAGGDAAAAINQQEARM